jgi:hypothetical protein
LHKLLIAEPDVAVQRRLQVLARPDVVALQHLLDPAVESLDHAVGLGQFRRGEAVFDTRFDAELIEPMLARGRARSPQIAQRAAGAGARVDKPTPRSSAT